MFGKVYEWTNVILVAGKDKEQLTEFHFSREVLSIASPIFKAMFRPDATNTERVVLCEEIPDPFALQELLRFISPVHHNVLTGEPISTCS